MKDSILINVRLETRGSLSGKHGIINKFSFIEFTYIG
jgi:hypothetical protein